MRLNFVIPSILLLASIVLAGDSPNDKQLIQVLDRPNRQAYCECSYYKRYKGGGHQGELIFNRSCDKGESPEAIMRIRNRLTILKPTDDSVIGQPCGDDASISEEWKAPGVIVELELNVGNYGTEACHSEGTLTVQQGDDSQTMQIVAECGI